MTKLSNRSTNTVKKSTIALAVGLALSTFATAATQEIVKDTTTMPSPVVTEGNTLIINESTTGNITSDGGTVVINNGSNVGALSSQGTSTGTINVQSSNVYGEFNLGQDSTLNTSQADGQGAAAFLGDYGSIILGQNSTLNANKGTTYIQTNDLSGTQATVNVNSEAVLVLTAGNITGEDLTVNLAEKSTTVLEQGYLTDGSTTNGVAGATLVGGTTGNAVLNMNGMTWIITRDSSLSTLTGNAGSTINFPAPNADGEFTPVGITVENLDMNNSTLNMHASLASGQMDSLTVTGSATGTGNVINANLFANGDQVLNLVTLPAGSDPATFSINSALDGFQEFAPNYEVVNTDNGVVYQLIGTGPCDANYSSSCTTNDNAVKAVTDVLNAKTFIFYNQIEQMDKRLGDLRNDKSNQNSGLWGKYEYQRSNLGDFSMDTSRFVIGIDKVTAEENGKSYFGVMGNLAKADGTSTDNSADTTYGSVGVYYSYLANSGFFSDFAVQYTRGSTDYKFVTDADGSGLNASHNNKSSMLSAALSLGYRFTSDGFFFEPSAQVATGTIDSTLVEGTTDAGREASAYLNPQSPLLTKTGAQMGYQFGGLSASVGAFYEKDWAQKDEQVTLQSGSSTLTYKAPKYARTVANFSLSGNISEDLNVYSRVEKSFGGDFETEIAGQVGVRYSF